MRIIPVILAFLVSAGVASAQDDAAIKRIIDRVDRVFAQRRARLSREIQAIIRQELERFRSKPSRPAPAKPKLEPKLEPKKPAPPRPFKKVRLGIVVEDFDEGERKRLGIGGGIKISEVHDPAKAAGIRGGDVLLELAGKPVTEDTILGLLEKYRPGDVVKAMVLRDGKRKTFDLKLAAFGE